MRTGMATLLVGAVVATLSTPADAQWFSTEPDSGIYAFGVGEVTGAPDRAIVLLMIDATDDVAVVAASANAALRRRVIDTLSALGLSPEVVTPAGYVVGPMQMMGMRAPRPDQGAPQQSARSLVRVEVTRLDRLDAVIEAALWAGASEVTNVLFEVGDSDALRARAVDQAVQHARHDAEVLARAAGGRLGRLLHLTTFPDFGAGAYSLQQMVMSGGSRGQVVPSDVRIRVQVQGRWELIRNR